LKRFWHIAVLFLAVFALVGGAFLGFSSCGGVAWHAPAIIATLATSTVGALLLPNPGRWPLLGKVAALIGVLTLFLLAHAGGAQFYPNSPASLSVFVSGLWRALLLSGC